MSCPFGQKKVSQKKLSSLGKVSDAGAPTGNAVTDFGPEKGAVLAIATVVIGNRGYRQNGSSFGFSSQKIRHGVALWESSMAPRNCSLMQALIQLS